MFLSYKLISLENNRKRVIVEFLRCFKCSWLEMKSYELYLSHMEEKLSHTEKIGED